MHCDLFSMKVVCPNYEHRSALFLKSSTSGFFINNDTSSTIGLREARFRSPYDAKARRRGQTIEPFMLGKPPAGADCRTSGLRAGMRVRK